MASRPRIPISWWRLWRGWLRPQWRLIALALVMTWVVALASAGYSKLIQMVMTAFQSGADLGGSGGHLDAGGW